MNFLWAVAGNVFSALSHLGMMVVLARLGGPEMVGLVVLAFAVCAPVNTLANLGLRVVLVTDARQERPFADYVAVRFVTAVLGAIAIAATALLWGYELKMIGVVSIVAAGKFFESLSDIYHGLFQQHERMDWPSLALIIRGTLALALMALAISATGSVIWGSLGYALGMAATFFAWDLPTRGRMRGTEPPAAMPPKDQPKESFHRDAPSPQPFPARGEGGCSSTGPTRDAAGARAPWRVQGRVRDLARLALLSFPQGVVMMMNSLTTNIPKYMIGYYLGSRALGIFSPIAYLAGGGLVLVTAMGHSVSPRLAKHYATGNTEAFLRLVGRFSVFVAGLGALAVLAMLVAGGPILRLLFGDEFADQGQLAVWLAVAGMLIYLTGPPGRAIDAMRRFTTHMMIRVFSVLVVVAILPGLIALDGLRGAALAMAVGAVIPIILCLATVLWGSAAASKESRRADGREGR